MKNIIMSVVLVGLITITGENLMASGAGAGYTEYQISKIEKAVDQGIPKNELKILKGQNGQNHR